VPKGGKSAPRRKNRIEGEGILPEESIGSFSCAFGSIQMGEMFAFALGLFVSLEYPNIFIWALAI